MKPSSKFFVDELLRWFATEGRTHLPWRRPGITPYEVWVSEIMLQQTQVSRVVPYFEKFLERFPTVNELANTTWEEFLPYYAGLGYYARGRNMLKTAQKVVQEFGGEFPADAEKLRSLPGVGPYTVKAILSFGYDEPHLAFDTNQQRLWGRYLEGERKAELDPLEIEKNLPVDTPYKQLNAAIMDFANAVCVKNPRCEICPLRPQCRYYQTQGELEEKAIARKSEFPTQQAQVWLFLHRQHQEYYSAAPEKFTPFILPVGLVGRHQIKEYFRRIYNLELSVRPSHAQGYIEEKPVMFTNAQILLGEPHFLIFSRREVKELLKKYQEKLLV